jgi:hypothetical protein
MPDIKFVVLIPRLNVLFLCSFIWFSAYVCASHCHRLNSSDGNEGFRGRKSRQQKHTYENKLAQQCLEYSDESHGFVNLNLVFNMFMIQFCFISVSVLESIIRYSKIYKACFILWDVLFVTSALIEA